MIESPGRRFAAALVSVTLLTIFATMSLTSPAAAGDGKVCSYTDSKGNLQYTVCGTIPGSGGSGGGGGGAPSCEFTGAYTDYCKGTVPCYYHNPAVLGEEEVGDLAGPKPEGDDFHIAAWGCADNTNEWFWTNDDTPPTEMRAWQAFGALDFPDFEPVFNPPARTIVNLETWWWADGASREQLIGTAAAGIRALAEPSHMEVDPGDGSSIITCDFSTSQADICHTVYQRSSDRQEGRAYQARMRLVWDVRFENGGAPLTLPGLPTSYTSDWESVQVPVREIQTVVRPSR